MALNPWAMNRGVGCSCPHARAQVSSQARVVASARRQTKRQRKKAGVEEQIDFDGPALGEYELVNESGTPVLPRAPSPGSIRITPSADDLPDKPYPVFAPKPSKVKSLDTGKWEWGEDVRKADDGPVIPEWNPRTGFTRSSAMSQQSTGGQEPEGAQGFGSAQAPPPDPQISLFTPAVQAAEDLPAVAQSQVLASCVGTTVWMTVLAFFLRAYAQANAPQVLGTDEALLAEFLALPSGLESWANVGVLLGCAGVVTAARLQLLNVWAEFKTATDRSNKQVLSPLSWLDIAVVAVLTGFSEELLFRGAILPASFLDWRGVLLSGLIFGALHNSGGRNAAFASWAGGVGCLYGAAYLYTHNIWVPAAAHALANFASAAVWKSRNSQTQSQ